MKIVESFPKTREEHQNWNSSVGFCSFVLMKHAGKEGRSRIFQADNSPEKYRMSAALQAAPFDFSEY